MLPRSYLFVPGNRPERFNKAAQSGADAIILDLEDAVPVADKVSAREHIRSWLLAGGSGYVRVNAAGTEWHDDDVRALAGLPNLSGIVLPKAEQPEVLHRVAEELHSTAILLPLIESANGFGYLQQICNAPKVQRLLFGTLDFQVDMQMRGTGNELLFFRSQLTLASRLAGIGSPVDGVTTAIDDARPVSQDTTEARNLGFGGKLCIHPKQVTAVHAAFSYTQDEYDWAKRVMEAVQTSAGAATTVDGKMVDNPVIQSAQRIIDRMSIA
ncbi:MAG: CoA ester lyase [Burkholderia sp.]|jgi:citrate lyase subunit beta/citryl-CoA lyase|uniref:HpcH/HpaI aldolase/citrate lyase family protein n=1 Tax=Burkholderia sp. TaxID=36773 RepID=UPI002828D4AE|nr:CoA ester lyase [Burkholderia sp.]MDR0242933.1 CoA ester lyase [Burkholderia sp.]